jgi:uncharacterized protein YbjT (DUF2867 family)
MILVTGVTGTVGSAVMEALRKTGTPFRAMVRSEGDAKKLPMGAAEVVGDFADKESLRRAFAGVERLFLVCSPIPQLVELESNAIDVCAEKGVQHVVLNSALGAGDYPKSFPAWHTQVENKLKGTQMGWTILRPNSFMQNILAFNAPSIRAQGAFYAAMGDAKLSFIDVRDVGAAAGHVLLAPGAHVGKAYELNGPEAVRFGEVAERIARIAGRSVQFVDIPEEAQRKAMLDLGMPEWQVNALLELQQYYSKLGKGGEVTDTLAKLLGRAPRTLDAFLEENKDAFRSQAVGA